MYAVIRVDRKEWMEWNVEADSSHCNHEQSKETYKWIGLNSFFLYNWQLHSLNEMGIFVMFYSKVCYE